MKNLDKMPPLVSIIIPVYNASTFIAKTIEFTLLQTYKNVELIIIDDGSKDSSFEIARQYEKDNVMVVKQANRGASAARNLGISLAQGEFIQFLDADDFIHPLKIERQIATLSDYSDLHLIGGTWQRFTNNLGDLNGDILPNTQKEIQCFDKVEWLINRPMMIPHTWLVSRRLIEMAGLWDEQLTLNDDGEFFYRVIAASSGVIIDRRAETYYRSFNSQSLSSRDDRKSMLSWISSIKSYKKIMENLAGDRGNDSVDRYFYLLYYWCLNKYPDLGKVCKSEMYNPHKTYQLEDRFVFKLSKLIGLSNAKRVNDYIHYLKQKNYIRKLIIIIKVSLGKASY